METYELTNVRPRTHEIVILVLSLSLSSPGVIFSGWLGSKHQLTN